MNKENNMESTLKTAHKDKHQMQTVRTFTVKASLPPALEDLQFIAHNLYWSWHYDITEIFRRIDYDLWKECGHNPTRGLFISSKKLEKHSSRHLMPLRGLVRSMLARNITRLLPISAQSLVFTNRFPSTLVAWGCWLVIILKALRTWGFPSLVWA